MITYEQAVYLIKPIYAVLAGQVALGIVTAACFVVFWFWFRR